MRRYGIEILCPGDDNEYVTQLGHSKNADLESGCHGLERQRGQLSFSYGSMRRCYACMRRGVPYAVESWVLVHTYRPPGHYLEASG